MAIAPTLEKSAARQGAGGPEPAPPRRDGAGGRPERPEGETRVPSDVGLVGVWLFVGAVTLLFAAFTSTLLTRRLQDDWQVGPMPPLLWVTTALLVASSAVLEWARRAARAAGLAAYRTGLLAAALLGSAFLVGQVVAWRQLIAGGIGLTAGPHSAFFYLLTGTHALHLAGGVLALAYGAFAVRRAASAAAAGAAVAPIAVYWHFVDVLWVYVLAVLFWL